MTLGSVPIYFSSEDLSSHDDLHLTYSVSFLGHCIVEKTLSPKTCMHKVAASSSWLFPCVPTKVVSLLHFLPSGILVWEVIRKRNDCSHVAFLS